MPSNEIEQRLFQWNRITDPTCYETKKRRRLKSATPIVNQVVVSKINIRTRQSLRRHWDSKAYARCDGPGLLTGRGLGRRPERPDIRQCAG